MIIHFEQMDVKVEQHDRLNWTAHAAELYGHGETMMEAIVDLREKLKQEEEENEM